MSQLLEIGQLQTGAGIADRSTVRRRSPGHPVKPRLVGPRELFSGIEAGASQRVPEQARPPGRSAALRPAGIAPGLHSTLQLTRGRRWRRGSMLGRELSAE